MQVWQLLLLIVVVVAAVLVALYFLGKRTQKKQNEQQAQIEAAKQTVSMLIIDKTSHRQGEDRSQDHGSGSGCESIRTHPAEKGSQGYCERHLYY